MRCICRGILVGYPYFYVFVPVPIIHCCRYDYTLWTITILKAKANINFMRKPLFSMMRRVFILAAASFLTFTLNAKVIVSDNGDQLALVQCEGWCIGGRQRQLYQFSAVRTQASLRWMSNTPSVEYGAMVASEAGRRRTVLTPLQERQLWRPRGLSQTLVARGVRPVHPLFCPLLRNNGC